MPSFHSGVIERNPAPGGVVVCWRCDRSWRLRRALTMTRWRNPRGKPSDVIILDSLAAYVPRFTVAHRLVALAGSRM